MKAERDQARAALEMGQANCDVEYDQLKANAASFKILAASNRIRLEIVVEMAGAMGKAIRRFREMWNLSEPNFGHFMEKFDPLIASARTVTEIKEAMDK